MGEHAEYEIDKLINAYGKSHPSSAFCDFMADLRDARFAAAIRAYEIKGGEASRAALMLAARFKASGLVK